MAFDKRQAPGEVDIIAYLGILIMRRRLLLLLGLTFTAVITSTIAAYNVSRGELIRAAEYREPPAGLVALKLAITNDRFYEFLMQKSDFSRHTADRRYAGMIAAMMIENGVDVDRVFIERVRYTNTLFRANLSEPQSAAAVVLFDSYRKQISTVVDATAKFTSPEYAAKLASWVEELSTPLPSMDYQMDDAGQAELVKRLQIGVLGVRQLSFQVRPTDLVKRFIQLQMNWQDLAAANQGVKGARAMVTLVQSLASTAGLIFSSSARINEVGQLVGKDLADLAALERQQDQATLLIRSILARHLDISDEKVDETWLLDFGRTFLAFDIPSDIPPRRDSPSFLAWLGIPPIDMIQFARILIVGSMTAFIFAVAATFVVAFVQVNQQRLREFLKAAA